MSTDREREPRDDELPSGAEMLDPRRGDAVKRSYRAVTLTEGYDVVDEPEHERPWLRKSMELMTRDVVIIAMVALILLIQVCHTLLLWEPWKQDDKPAVTGEVSDGRHQGTAQDNVVELQTKDDVGAAGET